jgi:hypothetical protein
VRFEGARPMLGALGLEYLAGAIGVIIVVAAGTLLAKRARASETPAPVKPGGPDS